MLFAKGQDRVLRMCLIPHLNFSATSREKMVAGGQFDHRNGVRCVQEVWLAIVVQVVDTQDTSV